MQVNRFQIVVFDVGRNSVWGCSIGGADSCVTEVSQHDAARARAITPLPQVHGQGDRAAGGRRGAELQTSYGRRRVIRCYAEGPVRVQPNSVHNVVTEGHQGRRATERLLIDRGNRRSRSDLGYWASAGIQKKFAVE